MLCGLIGAQGESRTHTPVKAGDFESPASTIPPLGPISVAMCRDAQSNAAFSQLPKFMSKVKRDIRIFSPNFNFNALAMQPD